jgi:hypothetical protein
MIRPELIIGCTKGWIEYADWLEAELEKESFYARKQKALRVGLEAENQQLSREMLKLRAAIGEPKFAFVKDVPAFKEILEAGNE